MMIRNKNHNSTILRSTRYTLLATTILLLLCILSLSYSEAAISVRTVENKNDKKPSFPNQQWRDWKHCYGEALDEQFLVYQASVTFVQTIHGNTPGVKLAVQLVDQEEGQRLETVFNNLPDLMYKFELWHESTGAKIQYKGHFSELKRQTDLIHNYQREEDFFLDDNNNNKDNKANATWFEIERPLHVDYDGNYEASVVLFLYKDIAGTDPIRREMDEKLCIDARFKFVNDKMNSNVWNINPDAIGHSKRDDQQVLEVKQEDPYKNKDKNEL